MRSVFIVGMCACLLGCVSPPNRKIPSQLSIEQVSGRAQNADTEFVFCDMKGGAWGCKRPTPKTRVIQFQSETPINAAVRSSMEARRSTEAQQAHIEKTPIAVSEANAKSSLNQGSVAEVFFKSSQVTLSAQAMTTLLNTISKIKGKQIEVHGYTDSFGDALYNKNLGLERAVAVKDFYVKQGLSDDSIQCYSHGILTSENKKPESMKRHVAVFVTN